VSLVDVICGRAHNVVSVMAKAEQKAGRAVQYFPGVQR
jgi:hypothetical protein